MDSLRAAFPLQCIMSSGGHRDLAGALCMFTNLMYVPCICMPGMPVKTLTEQSSSRLLVRLRLNLTKLLRLILINQHG